MWDKLLAAAKSKPKDITQLQTYMRRHPDLDKARQFPGTDLDILTAVVVRMVYDEIFQKCLFGDMRRRAELITSIEASMRCDSMPKRGQPNTI